MSFASKATWVCVTSRRRKTINEGPRPVVRPVDCTIDGTDIELKSVDAMGQS